jgi:mRNA-degrading endonuclease RelE of RelBE toxin-antitoxin system
VTAFKVEVKPSAEKFVLRQDAKTRERINEKIAKIAKDPLDLQYSKGLGGHPGMRSARVGDLRIIFQVDIDNRIITVLVIDSRGQVYKRLD